MIQKRNELENLQERLNGLVFDIEYSGDAVKDLGTSDEHLNVSYYIQNKFIIIIFCFQNIITYLDKAASVSKQVNLLRQQQIQQQLFEKKDGSLLPSIKN